MSIHQHVLGAIFLTLIAVYTFKHGNLIGGLVNAAVVMIFFGMVYGIVRWIYMQATSGKN